ncbi:MAG: PHB depolymerase family esterase [Nevskia sp.]|nr:PHB depolymerase family esterase [Nevskia sp.]
MKQLFGTLLATTQTVSQPLIDPVTGLLIPPTGGTLQETLIRVNGTYVIATPGETAYNATITVNGTSRNYVVLRPDPAPPSAPLLLLLHGVGGTAAGMANLAQVAGYVSAQGFWAVMPQGINDSWNDDPTTGNDDDVQFISQLIDTLVAAGGIDATRVYAAGISNGGFMTDRLACELSDKIAGFGMVSATIRTGLMKNCSPAVQRPKLFILGTTDPIVPYQGWGSLSDIESAAQAVSYWAGLQGCTSPGTTALPVINNDGTSIELETFAGCGGGAPLELYTVNGGGHAWPGGWQYLPVPIIGKTSTNLSATGVIWNLVSAYHL